MTINVEFESIIDNQMTEIGIFKTDFLDKLLSEFILWLLKTAYMFIWKEGNVLFNDALNTFYLWLYGKGPLR